MGYWKSKVLPKIKKVFEKNGSNKKAAFEASKSFDDSKEEINKELEEKKTELHPKVLEIYEASSTEIKALVKEPHESELKKNSTAVTTFLEELAKIDFPGSKLVSDAVSKFGPVYVSGPVFFILEKVSTLLPPEEESGGADKDVVVAADDEEKAAEELFEKIEEKAVTTEEAEPRQPA